MNLRDSLRALADIVRRNSGTGRPAPRALKFDELESRKLLAVSASMAGTQLNVIGDGIGGPDTITISSADGVVTVNGGAVAIVGGAPAPGAVTAISVVAAGGADSIDLSDVDGGAGGHGFAALDGDITIDGAAGNDNIIGSDFADSILGGGGTDTIVGLLGNDTILGGADNDSILGLDGHDSLLGGGWDRFSYRRE